MPRSVTKLYVTSHLPFHAKSPTGKYVFWNDLFYVSGEPNFHVSWAWRRRVSWKIMHNAISFSTLTTLFFLSVYFVETGNFLPLANATADRY